MVKSNIKEKLNLEKTLREEILQKACKMTSKEINEKIDGYLKLILDKRIDGENLLIIKEKARIYADIVLRRSGS